MTKRTLHGSLRKAISKSGFRARMKSSKGRNIVKSRRRKNRKKMVSI